MREAMVSRIISNSLLLLSWLWVLPSPTRAAAPPDSLPEPPTARVRAWQTGLLAPDRLQHGSLSLTHGVGAGMAGARPLHAFLGTSALGIAKEWRDHQRTRFDPVDLAADVIGAAIGSLLAREFRR